MYLHEFIVIKREELRAFEKLERAMMLEAPELYPTRDLKSLKEWEAALKQYQDA